MISASMETPLPQAQVLGLPLHLAADYSQWLADRVRSRQGTHVVTLNAEMAMQAQQDPQLAAVIQGAELVVPDGAGVVFYLRLRRQRIQRSPGIEVAENLVIQAAQEGWSVFLLGGAPGVAQAAGDRWQARYPQLTIAGVHHGYFTDADEAHLTETLRRANPQIILVALGVPRQEFWIQTHRALCPGAVWMGVGGSFDIWAEVKSRAPEWLRENHLEWSYRLYQEPHRWRRMMALPKFAWKALRGQ
jgi:N-acetylglucosaminyldiphosphoundecaprenol N-acetyl-beta-D-mannosaminyltransferase